MPFKDRNQMHWARRIWHVGGVLFIFTLYHFVSPHHAMLMILPAATFMIAFDWARLRDPRLNRFFQWLFRPFMRESERHRLAGSTGMMAGLAFVICLLPHNVAKLTLLFLAFGDPAASFFGIRYGKDKLVGHKTLQGTLGAFAACFLVSLVFFSYMDLMRERLFIVCLLTGLIGAVSELVPIWKFDDNFVFPVLGGIMLTGVFHIFGGLG